MKLKLIAIALAASLSGCAVFDNSEVVEPDSNFRVEKGSLRQQTLLLADYLGLETIYYHHSIAREEDYELRSSKLITSAKQNKQTALINLYANTPYIPLVVGNEVTIYPTTTSTMPSNRAALYDVYVPAKQVIANNGTNDKLELEPKSVTTKVAAAKVDTAIKTTNKEAVGSKSAASSSTSSTKNLTVKQQFDEAMALTASKLGDVNTPTSSTKQTVLAKGSEPKKITSLKTLNKTGTEASLPKSSSTNTNKLSEGNQELVTKTGKPTAKALSPKTVETKQAKSFTAYKGQTLRDVFSHWLQKFEVESVHYDVSQQLATRFNQPLSQNISITALNEQELLRKVNDVITDESLGYSFKARLVRKGKQSSVIIHQYPFDEVELFKIKVGTLKDNAYELAKHYGYAPIEAEEKYAEYSSWAVNINPISVVETELVVGPYPRIAFSRLFKNYNVMAQIQESNKTIYFVPKNSGLANNGK